MNDANTSSSALPTPFSHLQHLLILGWKTGQSPKIRRNPGATEHEDGNEERLARARETERERGSDGVLGRARQLRLPTMAAQGGLHLRVSWGREKREDERERLKGGALLGVTLCGAPPRRETREREKQKEAHRPKD